MNLTAGAIDFYGDDVFLDFNATDMGGAAAGTDIAFVTRHERMVIDDHYWATIDNRKPLDGQSRGLNCAHDSSGGCAWIGPFIRAT